MRLRGALVALVVFGCRSPEPTRADMNVPLPPPAASSAAPSAASAASAPTGTSSVDAAAPPVVRAGKPRGPIATSAQALKTFVAAWDEEIVPNAVASSHTSDVHAGKGAQAKLGACREGYRRVKDTLGPGEGSLVLFSATSALDRPGDCWEVVFPTGPFNEILGYLDPKTGALILAWLVPEG